MNSSLIMLHEFERIWFSVRLSFEKCHKINLIQGHEKLTRMIHWDTKTLMEPLMTYFQLDPQEEPSRKSKWKQTYKKINKM